MNRHISCSDELFETSDSIIRTNDGLIIALDSAVIHLDDAVIRNDRRLIKKRKTVKTSDGSILNPHCLAIYDLGFRSRDRRIGRPKAL